MKTEGQIRHKLKQALFRHMKKRVSASQSRTPSNCLHNQRPQQRTPSGNWIPHPSPSFCLHPDFLGHLCDEGHPEEGRCWENCGRWEPRRSKEEVKRDFTEFAKRPREEIAGAMPDVAAYLWVLEQPEGMGSEGMGSEGRGSEGTLEATPSPPRTFYLKQLLIPEALEVLHPWWLPFFFYRTETEDE